MLPCNQTCGRDSPRHGESNNFDFLGFLPSKKDGFLCSRQFPLCKTIMFQTFLCWSQNSDSPQRSIINNRFQTGLLPNLKPPKEHSLPAILNCTGRGRLRLMLPENFQQRHGQSADRRGRAQMLLENCEEDRNFLLTSGCWPLPSPPSTNSKNYRPLPLSRLHAAVLGQGFFPFLSH